MVASDQLLVHTPFVPSGYWSPCAPMVWNEGFSTPLCVLSMSTNPVKAPDTRFSSSQFRKQHPCHEKASWMSEINANIQSNNNNNILIILVGNKLDEERNRMVSKKEGERLAQVNEYYFKCGIQWTFGMQLDDLDFADDLALLSQTQQQMQEKTISVAAVSTAVGLNIHKEKSKILRCNTACTNPITIDRENLEDVKTFTYLGSIIDEHGGSDADMKARQTDALFWETSAKTGANVDSMFHCIAERLLEIQTSICTISPTNSTQQSNGYSTTINEIHNSISSNQSSKSQSFKLNHSTKPLRTCCSS
ncbi:unnamed protein product [Schistosoma margrebowiei]|uniref:Uncharacterized protein n=1 Tax=Schistosoma margrebowiei TaxID=48269 RepID=A0A183LF20_9TREM|nr:unnamed protein product [Schistosoma margrebowiei]